MFHADRRVRRPVAKILHLIAESGGNSSMRHQDVAAKGGLRVLANFLEGDDYDQKLIALATLAHLARSREIKRSMCVGRVLEALTALTDVNDDGISAKVARIFAELVEDPQNARAVGRATNTVPALVRMCSPYGSTKGGRTDALRALASMSNEPPIRKTIVGAGALGYLISLKKSGRGLDMMFARATLGNLSEEAAALQIQMAFRGFRGRKVRDTERRKKRK